MEYVRVMELDIEERGTSGRSFKWYRIFAVISTELSCWNFGLMMGEVPDFWEVVRSGCFSRNVDGR